MFSKLLRQAFKRPTSRAGASREDAANDITARLHDLHKNAPRELHRAIMFNGIHLGSAPLLELVDSCSAAGIAPAKFAHRPLSLLFLGQYLLHAARLRGARAECGVYGGASALLMCKVLAREIEGYRGEDLHLIDSFAGLGEASSEDLIAFRDPTSGQVSTQAGYATGAFGTSDAIARRELADFPRAVFHKGVIPQVLATLPETTWSFVHIDVDLYEPTFACLDYFYPRLVEKGVILCDDYGAPMFPGAQKAWDEYCAEREINYVVLDTGQSVLLKAP